MSIRAAFDPLQERSTVCLPCTLRPCALSVIAPGVGVGVGVTVGVGVGVGVAVGVGVGVGVGPLYSSALALTGGGPFTPPATSTMPLGSKVAVCQVRASLRAPV